MKRYGRNAGILFFNIEQAKNNRSLKGRQWENCRCLAVIDC